MLLELFGRRPAPRRSPRTRSTPPSPPPASDLPGRLHALGLPATTPVRLTRNRTVMLSWSARGGLRVHAGYAAAPDQVLQAIVRFVKPRLPRADRAAARRTFMAFPALDHAPARSGRPRRARAVPAADRPIVAALREAHARFNQQHFAGALPEIPITLSDRMHRRLGELRAARNGSAEEITLSSRHIRRDGWEAALDTLLHEMVHQWQAESGFPLDHGTAFRKKARAVGIVPRAVADLRKWKR